jgi:glutamate--cysteine ligase
MTRFGWKPVIEKGMIIALSNDSQCSITLEPGGQFEFAALLETLHDLWRGARASAGARSLRRVGARMTGSFRSDRGATVPWMPKGRYRIMRDYMPKKGQLGLDMMLRTCTVQTNLDY